MNIFLLEDDFMLHKAIKNALIDDGNLVDGFYDGLEGLSKITTQYDLFIVDVYVPYINGLELISKIKKVRENSKIIIISADNNIQTIKKAYQQGCDDFLKKPFDIEELLLKVQKIKTSSVQTLNFNNGISYAFHQKSIYFNTSEVILTKKETTLIDLLINNLHNGVSYDVLIDVLYEDDIGSIDALRSLVKRLRKKLPDGFIQTTLSGRYKINQQ